MLYSIYRWTLAALCLSIFSLHAQTLTLQRLYSDPSLNGKAPVKLKMSPDGKRVTYLRGSEEDYNRYDLWEYHLSTKQNRLLVDSKKLFSGPESLSDEEKARRERQRIFGKGILEYTWSKDGNALLFPLNGELYYYNLTNRSQRQLTHTEAFETDARFSPQGRYVSFIREQNLYIIDVITGKETAITQDGAGLRKNGMAEFVAQEEMDRMTGYWWSKDDKRIAFLRVDESPVQEAVRNEIYADEIKLFNQRYPFTGTANALVELAVYSLDERKTQSINTQESRDSYIPRVNWSRDSRYLTYQWQSRDQKTLKLKRVDLASNTQETLFTETAKTWINLHHDLYFLKDKQHFIWASERDGFKHLYLYRFDGTLVRQLTQGKWIVDELEGVDEKTQTVYFSGRADTPLEKHFYAVPLFSDKPSIKRITALGKYHEVELAQDFASFIDTASSAITPPQVALNDIQGNHLTWLEENAVEKSHPLSPFIHDLITPEYGTLTASDGQTLHYRIYKPHRIKGKHPVIVNVYGGPHAQRVVNQWSKRNLFLHYMAQRGYVIFQLDNRGSFNRGKAFEDPIYQHLGVVEVEDQVAGVQWLRKQAFVDPKRIGIYGHSYGGYMALMGLFKAGDYFTAGVSGAPVTDWALYDTHYTERYLGHPQQNAKGYEKSAVFPYATNLSRPLLVYHGMADDNVLFTHATKLFKTLQDDVKSFEMMTYPGSKHSLRGKHVQHHLKQTIADFFDRHFQQTDSTSQ